MIGMAKNLASVASNVSYTAYITPSNVFVFSFPGSASSGTVTMNNTGGTSPFTYAWIKLSGDSEINISASTGQSVFFSAYGSGFNVFSATYQCTITDFLSADKVATVDVTFTFEE